jgi:uncharacterized membrane protein YhhN
MKLLAICLIILFWLLLACDCALIFLDLNDYRFYTKPLLVPLLLVFMLIKVVNTKRTKSRLIITSALLLCFAGDLILLFDQLNYSFIIGLILFLLAHIFYIAFFYRLVHISAKKFATLVIAAILTGGYIFILLSVLWEKLQDAHLQLPVVLYATVLGCMLLAAVNTINGDRLGKLNIYYFIPGAVLFVFSDSMLAVNKFMLDHKYIAIGVMLTYATAQFLIVKGAAKFMKYRPKMSRNE